MQIIDIEPVVIHVNHRGDWICILVHTDQGITGLGEASHTSNDALLLDLLARLKPQLIGQSATNVHALWQKMASIQMGRVSQTLLSGIEMAMWDAFGQQVGQPIHALLGGALRNRIRLYANINRHVRDRSPGGFAKAAAQAVDEGFTAIKLAPFDELRPRDHIRTGPKATWRPGVERVRAVRKAIGDDIELAIDCHSRMEQSEAIIVGQELADCNLFWYEEPVHKTMHNELAAVTQAVPQTTASAESIFAVEGFRPFLERHLVDVLMPDVKHVGGLQETKNVAEAARASGLLIAPHNPSGPVASVASGQVCATLRNFYILEYAWGEVDWRAQLLEPAERIEDGYLIVSDEP
ncbi:MAG: mandelate racemase/muconate lactonizing enzyme family protein, partial [Caldilineaceae bacterium]|nr:mandelate racemase/muconate lactonizing enzyme family protein [Caldilineaceae bacterium]